MFSETETPALGNVITIESPPWGALRASIVPPKRRAIFAAVASPKPLPLLGV
jgi:hypothetical protein